MYGMVNKAIEQMVTQHHGRDTWLRIREKAGVSDEVFIGNESYPDDLTYRLVGAACEVLGKPASEILFAFGEHWVLVTAMQGYGAMMRSGGRTLGEFLLNLPNFHTRVVMILPRLHPPRFECSEVTDRSLHLHYHSDRPGLTDFVRGLISGLGKAYQTPVSAELVKSKAAGDDHDIFHVSW